MRPYSPTKNKLSENTRQDDRQRASKSPNGFRPSHTTLRGEAEKFNCLYTTPDLMMAAYMKAKGLQLIDTKNDNGRIFFRFQDTPERLAFCRSFFNNGVIGITDFKSHLNDLKILLNQRG